MNLLDKVVRLKRQPSSRSDTKTSTVSCSSEGASRSVGVPFPVQQARTLGGEGTVAPSTRVVRGTGGGRRAYSTSHVSKAERCRAIEAAMETSSSKSELICGSRHPVVRSTASNAQRSREIELGAAPSQTVPTAQQLGGDRHPATRSASVVENRHTRKDTTFARTDVALKPPRFSSPHVASNPSLASLETSSYFDEIPEMAQRVSLPRQSASESSEPTLASVPSAYSSSTYSINSLPFCGDGPPGRGRFSIQSFDSVAASTYSAELVSAKIVPLYRTYASSQVVLPHKSCDSIAAASNSTHRKTRNSSFPSRNPAAVVPILPSSPLKTAPPTTLSFKPAPARRRVLEKRKKKHHYKPFHIVLEEEEMKRAGRIEDQRNALNAVLYSPASFSRSASTPDVSYYPRAARPNPEKGEPPSKSRANIVDQDVPTHDRGHHPAFISRQLRTSLDDHSVKEGRKKY